MDSIINHCTGLYSIYVVSQLHNLKTYSFDITIYLKEAPSQDYACDSKPQNI